MRWIDKPRKKTRKEVVLEYIKFMKVMGYYDSLVAYMYSLSNNDGMRVHIKGQYHGALAECESREPQIRVVEKIVEVQAPANTATVVTNGEQWVVAFATASSKLSNEAKFILNQIGNDAIVDVVATASPDGSASFNQKLSEKRAAVVSDYLTNRGVKVNSAVGKGVDPKTGRAAIVKTLQ